MNTLDADVLEFVLPNPAGDEQDVSWRKQAECVGEPTELFFSERPSEMDKAKAICARCPVRSECVTEGLALGHRYDQGIRGGLSANIRNRTLRRGKPYRKYRPDSRMLARWNARRQEYEVSLHER